MLNIHFAISAVVLFCTMAVLLFISGGDWVKAFILWSLWIGGFAQFVAQDDGIPAKTVGLILSYVSILLGLVAMIVYTVGLAYN